MIILFLLCSHIDLNKELLTGSELCVVQVPRVDDPQGMWQKLSEFLQQYKKELPGSRKPSDGS